MSTHEYVMRLHSCKTLVVSTEKKQHDMTYSTKWCGQSDKQAMIADQLSRSVHFNENYPLILSMTTNSNTNHNHKHWKLMCGQ